MTRQKLFTAKNITVGILLLAALVILIASNIPFLDAVFHFVPKDYSSANPPIFFSIGEAVAAIAITLTIWQFKKNDWEIAIETRRKTIPIVCVLIGAGFALEIVASLVTFATATNIFEVSLVWQLLGSFFILAAPVYLFIGTRQRGLFSEATNEDFLRALMRRVSSRSPEKMDLVSDALLANMDAMLDEISSAPLLDDIPELTRYAHLILRDVVADPAFARHIVTRRADFFQYFLRRIIEEYHGSADTLSVVFDAFMKAAFANKDSYFYSEMEHTGFGDYKPFLNDVFGNQKIFLNLKPFDQIDFPYGEVVDAEKLKVFLEALGIAVKAYWERDKNTYLDFEYSHYRTAFEKVEEAFSRIVEEARPGQEKDSRPNHSWQISSKLQKIGFFINWELLHLYDDALKEDRISENDKQANIRKVDYGWYPTSMTAAYAELVFKLLCDLSSYPVKEAQRDFALQIAGDLIVFDHHPSVEKIREILLEFIWKQINGDDLASNIKGYFPAILPVFLSLVSMWQHTVSQKRKDLYNKTVEFLDNELKPKILAGEKMANKEDIMEEIMLPPSVVFDRKKNIFVWHGSMGSMQDMIVRK